MRIPTIMVLSAVAFVIITLFGCEQEVPKTPAKLPTAVGYKVVCMDGWEAIVTGEAIVYRHEHDVQEHLISCKEN